MLLLYDRKRAYMLIAIIILLISATTVFSYAFTKQNNEPGFSITNNDLVTTFTTPSDNIQTNIEFVQSEENLELPKYNFTIKNIADEKQYYNINIKINNEVDKTLLPYLKVIIDNNEPVYLINNSSENPYSVYLGELNSKVANTHNLSIYLYKEDAIGNELIDINYFELDFTIEVSKTNYTPNFQENIRQLAQNSQELFQDEHGNIRYYGANPNNYINFNNELWRIIGIIKTKTPDGEKELIKIVRNDYIANTSMDYKSNNNYSSNFQESQLYQILNVKGYWTKEVIACPNTQNSKLECDFTNSGLQDDSKNYIAEVIYNQGGWNTNKIAPSAFYLKEKSVQKNTAKVTLLTASDYGYAAGPSFQNVYFDSFDKSPKNSNWLFKDKEWLISPNIEDYRKAYSINQNGQVVTKINVNKPQNIRPVVYLNENLILESGEGTETSPYQLALTNN